MHAYDMAVARDKAEDCAQYMEDAMAPGFRFSRSWVDDGYVVLTTHTPTDDTRLFIECFEKRVVVVANTRYARPVTFATPAAALRGMRAYDRTGKWEGAVQ